MPTECLTCKPGDATFHNAAVANTGCENTYQLVDECMKAHNGRVSACKAEWELFRKCHERGKVAKAAASGAAQASPSQPPSRA